MGFWLSSLVCRRDYLRIRGRLAIKFIGSQFRIRWPVRYEYDGKLKNQLFFWSMRCALVSADHLISRIRTQYRKKKISRLNSAYSTTWEWWRCPCVTRTPYYSSRACCTESKKQKNKGNENEQQLASSRSQNNNTNTKKNGQRKASRALFFLGIKHR